jgi:hypothetical protein
MGKHLHLLSLETVMKASAGVDLYWLPLGAGGRFVAFNGRVYEAILARRDHREPLDIYHTALMVTVPEGRFVVENAWPIPDANPTARGVTVEGPVWAPALGRFRTFRYEVRRWQGGVIADIAEAIGSPERITTDEGKARAVLTQAEQVPAYVWGRDVLGIGEMWNSNSVISWLLTRAGLPAGELTPPPHGRAPGWVTGVVAARNVMPLAATPPAWSTPRAGESGEPGPRVESC